MPDDYPWLPGSSRFPLGDLGELSARLGSPVVYDRRGEVIWMDDFRHGVKGWQTQNSGAGSAVRLAADPRYSSPYCAELVAGSTLSERAQMIKSFSGLQLGRVGFEIAFEMASTFEYLEIQLSNYTESRANFPTIRYDRANTRLQYLNAAAGYTDIVDLPASALVAGQYQLLKLVADLDTGDYVRALLEGVEYDLSGLAFLQSASVVFPHNAAYVTYIGRAGFNDTLHLGHAILTGNEP